MEVGDSCKSSLYAWSEVPGSKCKHVLSEESVRLHMTLAAPWLLRSVLTDKVSNAVFSLVKIIK